MRRQQADLRCAHEPPAGTVASATFESPLERRGCLSAPKLGKLPLGVTVTVTITPVRNAGDGVPGPRSYIIVTCAARPPGLSRTEVLARSRSKRCTGGHHFTS